MLRINRGVEERAAATVPASIGDSSVKPRWLLRYSLQRRRRVSWESSGPTAPVGDTAYPVLSTVPSVKGPFTDSTEAAQTDAEFRGQLNLSPERLAGVVLAYTRTDAAQIFGFGCCAAVGLEWRAAREA